MRRRFSGYIMDLDGTVYRGDRLISGADSAVASIRRHGAGVVFLSNNPTRTREEYAAKLTRLAIPAKPDDVISSSAVLTAELQREAPGSRVYVIGETPLASELMRAGFIPALEPAETDFVILAFDRTFHYGKLLFAHRAAKHGARLWATNPDRACPVQEGDIPDCAAIIAALEACTGRKVERVLGKPSPTMIEAAARRLGCPLGDCLLVGDRLETDILMARNARCPSALVLTGVTTREMLQTSNIQPDYVLASIADITRSEVRGPGSGVCGQNP